MKNDLRFLAGFVGLLAVGAVALAQDEVKNPHWLSEQEIEAIVGQEPPPPALGTPAQEADVAAELDAQNSRTPARIAEALADNGYSVTLFTTPLEPGISAQNDPQTFVFFDRLNRQVGKIVGESKDHWHRLRPYQQMPSNIHPLFQAGGFSYPSGHATHSFAFAVILGQLFPDQAAAFIDRARQIAQSRVDAGVHYETDIREGEVVGREIARELLAKPAFVAELNAAKTELAAKK